jgi:hypothetical protein
MAVWFAAIPSQLTAQTQGNNSVYGTGVTFSTAYIDASAVAGTSSATNICAKINAALGLIHSTPNTAVIDARGISSLTCPSGDTPWTYGGTTYTSPATILLPAGTITISNTWVLPNQTRIVGEGSGSVVSGTAVTTIKTSSALNPMIQMGISTGALACPTAGCTGISVEDLVLNGEGAVTVGIINTNAQEQSYIRRVAFYQIPGTGFRVGSGAQNSGPYTDITFDAGTSTTSSTICGGISGVSTRGIHGLTCTNTGTVPGSGAAVLLAGSNNSLENVTVQGFYDGVKIGSNGTAQGNIVLNVANGTPSVSNAVIHIVTTNPVSDLTIMGVNKGSASYSIEDDITAGTPLLADKTVGMYAIGESVTVTNATKAYSRFTTSPSVPTWIRGNTTPSTPCVIGSLYSNSAGTGPNTDFYVCTATTTWTGID